MINQKWLNNRRLTGFFVHPQSTITIFRFAVRVKIYSCNTMALLVSYKDADVYDRDAVLFKNKNWLNDSCINFCLRRMEISTDRLLLMDPSVVSFLRLQCSDEDEYEEIRQGKYSISSFFFQYCRNPISATSLTGTRIASKEWVFVPINDNESFQSSSTHWSSLILHIPSQKFWHYDSCHQQNYASAMAVMAKLCILLR